MSSPAPAAIRSLDGVFLTPRNLWNLSVQTSAVAVMATGMVLVIVIAQHRPVGRLAAGLHRHGHGRRCRPRSCRRSRAIGNPLIWIIALVVGLALGLLIGAFQGFIIAYLEVPAFIVTLGGLLVWRGAAWWVTTGQTVAPLDADLPADGRRRHGSIGATLELDRRRRRLRRHRRSRIVNGRRQRRRFNFPLRPIWAEVTARRASAAPSSSAPSGVAKSYPWPIGIAHQIRRAAQHHRAGRGGLFISHRHRDPGADRARRRRGHDLHRQPHALRPLRLRHRRQSRGGRTRRHQHPLGDHEGLHADGRAVRRSPPAISIGAPERRDQRARHARRTLRHRRRGHRRHVARRRHRHDRRRHARRAGDAVAAVRHGADRRRLAAAEHRRRRRAGPRGLASTPSTASAPREEKRPDGQDRCPTGTPLVEMRDISVAFGGIHAVDDASIDLYPGEVVAWSATTAPASRR